MTNSSFPTSHDDHHDDHDHPVVDRRSVLRIGGLGMLTAMASNIALLNRTQAAAPGVMLNNGSLPQKTLVFVFMRGGADAMYLFPPTDDVNGKALEQVRSGATRPPAKTFVDKWGLNPLLDPLKGIPLKLMVSAGVIDGRRSHFDCQRWIERGSKDLNDVTGLFDKVLREHYPNKNPSSLTAVAAGSSSLPASLVGKRGAVAIRSMEDFAIHNGRFCAGIQCTDDALEQAMKTMLGNGAGGNNAFAMTRQAESVMLAAIDEVRSADAQLKSVYSDSSIGNGLKLLAQLIKSKKGNKVSIATVDWANVWDSHASVPSVGSTPPSNSNGLPPYAKSIFEGARDLRAFYDDLGGLMDDVVVVVGSEFGRTINANGSGGSDHGRGGAWFAFGGGISQGLSKPKLVSASHYSIGEQLQGLRSDPNAYTPVNIDYRNILCDVLQRHLNVTEDSLRRVYADYGSSTFRRMPSGLYA